MYFLIDYENVQKDGFTGAHLLNKKDTLIIFFSEHCKMMDGKIFSEIRKSKCKIDVRKLVKPSPNALDFYIASETGRIFGSGYTGEIAIVSKDNGFHAVVDYWLMNEQNGRIVITGSTIENCMSESKIDEARVKTIQEERVPIALEALGQNSPYEEEKSSVVRDLFKDTPYENCSAKVEDFVLNANDKWSIHQKIIKEFGMDTGIAIYQYVKPLVKKLDLPSRSYAA